MTWDAFLKTNKEQYRVIRTSKDLEDVPGGHLPDCFHLHARQTETGACPFIKLRNRKLCLVFDESDEITNPNSQRTKYVLCHFSQAEITSCSTREPTTRNNISKLYSQFELLYNNSVNMICRCDRIYREKRSVK